MTAIEKLARKYGEIGQDGDSSVIAGVRTRQATEDVALFGSAGVIVVDPDDDATVERAGEALWLAAGQMAGVTTGSFESSPFRDHYREMATAVIASLAVGGGT